MLWTFPAHIAFLEPSVFCAFRGSACWALLALPETCFWCSYFEIAAFLACRSRPRSSSWPQLVRVSKTVWADLLIIRACLGLNIAG